MRHPGTLLIPLLMLSDYLLTIAGARLRLDGYGAHFRTRHYELNPVWQDAVAKLRWFNPRHLLITAIVSTIVIAGIEPLPDDDALAAGLLGFVIGVFGAVNGRHLSNLATFAYLKRHPESIEGAVTMSHELVLRISIFQSLGLVVPALLLACLSREPIVLGFAAGATMLIAVHLRWLSRHRRKMRDAASADQAGAGDIVSTAVSSASSTNCPPASSSAKSPPRRTSSS